MPGRAVPSAGNWGGKLNTDLALAALRQAIEVRQPKPGLVHHSDGGSQYASAAYVKQLESIGRQLRHEPGQAGPGGRTSTTVL